MDNPVVKTEREGVPDWAKPQAGTAEQVTAEAVSGVPKITEKQRSFLLDLIAKKQVKPEHEGRVDLIMKCLRISEDPEEYGMSRDKASELITWYLKQPDKPREEQPTSNEDAERMLIGVPPGRYAVESDAGELRFYSVWQSQDKKRLRVYVCHGPDESSLKYHKTMLGVLKKIKADGIRKAAIRYGMEIGACSNCGRRLTNRISRALGIGPICGGRMFGEDTWKDEVKATRADIKAQGFDPDENLDDA